MNYFERVDSASLDIDNEKLDEIFFTLEDPKNDVHSMMLLYRGEVIREYYRKPYVHGNHHTLFSVTKSFTAVAAGFAMQDGLLDVSDRIVDFFPEYIDGNVCENMRSATVYNLLTMTVGFDVAPDGFRRHYMGEIINEFPYSYRDMKVNSEINWLKDFLTTYVPHKNGEKYIYSNACSYVLSCIIAKVTGKTLEEYIKDKLFTPLHITDYIWQKCPKGQSTGGWGLSLSDEDLLKFGQFMLNRGSFEGRQLLNPEFFDELSKPHVSTGNPGVTWEKNFGYQVWILGNEGIYAGIGAFGQMYVVYPKHDLVFVMLSATYRYMKLLDIIAGELPKAFNKASASKFRLSSSIKPISLMRADGENGNEIDGKYVFGDNILGINSIYFRLGSSDSIELTVNRKASVIKIGKKDYEYSVMDCGDENKLDIHYSLFYPDVAASGKWENGHYRFCLDFHKTAYKLTFDAEFIGNAVILKTRRNLGFIREANATLTGVKK